LYQGTKKPGEIHWLSWHSVNFNIVNYRNYLGDYYDLGIYKDSFHCRRNNSRNNCLNAREAGVTHPLGGGFLPVTIQHLNSLNAQQAQGS